MCKKTGETVDNLLLHCDMQGIYGLQCCVCLRSSGLCLIGVDLLACWKGRFATIL